ncbi:hypothetical protein Scep_015923 [Stephania cephalantha]|uniref:TF-B3 domain-containing protein n=1 Tax=Stephania cephalantha TaxID=152367 RepID=A0AAP0IM73_9MAGN
MWRRDEGNGGSIERENKILLPSLISVSAETAEAAAAAPSMDLTRGFMFGESRGKRAKCEEDERVINQGFAPFSMLPSQPGFIQFGTELTPAFPGLNDLWSPQPLGHVGHPYQYQVFPYNGVCVSTTAAPNLKRKAEGFGNAPHMETLFGLLRTGYLPVQALFQNPFFPPPMRSPLNYPMSSPFMRSQEMNAPMASWGSLVSESLIGSASAPLHEQKVIQPNLASSTGITVASDESKITNSETSSRCWPLSSKEQNGLEEASNAKQSSISTGLKIQSGCSPLASLHKSDDEKEIEGKGWKVLVQKELRNTDVGNLGRIILPKKDAEGNLPQLVAKDGIILRMEDMALSVDWKFKFRYWPNNKRDFVRTHNLKTGDFFIVYKEESSGKYIAHGKKGKEKESSGNMVERRNSGREDERECRTKSLFRTEQRTSKTSDSDCWIHSKTDLSKSASGDSFDNQGDRRSASQYFR